MNNSKNIIHVVSFLTITSSRLLLFEKEIPCYVFLLDRFDPHFGTRVNTELWCDSGMEPEKLHSNDDLFYTPIKLTECMMPI